MSGSDDEVREIYESEGDLIHQAARDGVTLEGKLLPTGTDEPGRVWVVRFELNPGDGG